MVGKTKSGKGTKLMVLTDGAGPPLGIHVEKTSPLEVKLAETTLDNIRVKVGKCMYGQPKRMVADRVYDRNKLRVQLIRPGTV